jgi:ComF family protein
MMDAVHQLKYGGKTDLARSLGSFLASFAVEWLNTPRGLLMMPVPLHPKKLRKRGFNQSLLLAREVQSRLAVELDFLSFKRIRNTPSQTGLKRNERRKNVRGAFHIDAQRPINGRAILLVDDVATTTSTLNECARVLKKAGSDKVFCLVLARTLN